MNKKNAFDIIMKDYEKSSSSHKKPDLQLDIKEKNHVNKEESWKFLFNNSLLVYNPFFLCKSNHITRLLSFDLDSTLIKTKSGKVFSINSDDWKLNYDNVPERIDYFYKKNKENTGLVIFSNQSKISDHSFLSQFKRKIESIVSALNSNFNLPFICLFSSKNDFFRKPSFGMFDYILLNFYPNLNLNECVFVGDAAGREKDFSDSDYKFAINSKIEFNIPENFFSSKGKEYKKIEFKLDFKFSDCMSMFTYDEYDSEEYLFWKNVISNANKANKKNLFLFVGAPGSGKSTFFYSHFEKEGYVRINNDSTTVKKANQILCNSLNQGEKIVVDNTNSKKSVRKEIISKAEAKEYSVFCIFFDFTKEMSIYLNHLRRLIISYKEYKSESEGKEVIHSNPVPTVAIHSYYKYLEVPSLEEGFKSIEKVNFKCKVFEDEAIMRIVKSLQSEYHK